MPERPTAIRTVAVVEPGLIGGSFGLALRHAGYAGSILGVGKKPYIEDALRRGAIDQITTLEEAAASADLLFLSGTVDHILETIEQLGPLVRTGCLVTDVGSTKRTIVEKAKEFLPGKCFIGGHPMAGKEKRGAEHAEPDLFQGRPYILTGQLETPTFQAFVGWLQLIGARIFEMDAEKHDATVAFSSHLPQLLSTALAFTLAGESDLPITSAYGSGLTDMTRLALSSPALWDSILAANRDQVVSAIDKYIASLNYLRGSLETGELLNIFEVARKYAYLVRNRS